MIAGRNPKHEPRRGLIPPMRNAISSLAIAIFGFAFVALLALNIRNYEYYASSFWSIAYYFALPAALGLATFAALGMPRAGRSVLTICLLSGVAGLYATEFYLTYVSPPCAACGAVGNGAVFDKRGKLDVILDLRRAGTDAYPTTRAKNLLVAGGGDALVSVLGDADGELLPLTSPPNTTVVSCNESGRWMIYRTDEHGFHNPPGLWSGQASRLVLVGDSFVQGNCVPSDGNIAAWLGKLGDRVLNLGVDGSGPLVELAILREYVEPLTPETVLWFYYEGNDLTKDLALEMRSETLMSYARDDNFRQGLVPRRDEVAARLKAYLDRRMPEAIDRVDEKRLVAAAKLVRVRGLLGLGPVSLGVVAGGAEARFALFHAILARAREAVASWGGRLIFVYLPESDRYFGLGGPGEIRERVRERVMATVAKLELPVIDVARAFSSHPDPLALFQYPGSHYNVRGYKVAAEAIQKALDR